MQNKAKMKRKVPIKMATVVDVADAGDSGRQQASPGSP